MHRNNLDIISRLMSSRVQFSFKSTVYSIYEVSPFTLQLSEKREEQYRILQIESDRIDSCLYKASALIRVCKTLCKTFGICKRPPRRVREEGQRCRAVDCMPWKIYWCLSDVTTSCTK
jgi:hypothetical protein